ncbi:MAG: hypothetical protein MUC93_12260 [Bacteroidales bacterium]|nr:hypothetical protein [Bacteroidales bacterium]
MIKIKHGYHEFDSSDTQQLHHATHAYVHVPVRILIWNNHFFTLSYRIIATTGLLYLSA